MFRPSSTSPFRAVAALNKFKIHHPTPLDKRESRRLLDVLTTSFRKQLDAEHPMPSSNPVSATTSLLPPPPKKPRRHSMSDLGKNATERHMTSVLTNPLFDVPPNKNDMANEKDPMDVFDRAVAAGLMTTQHAAGILKAKKKTLQGTQLRHSGAGLRVLKWLVNSGQMGYDPFLKDLEFTKIFTKFLVAEGLQEAAWFWIKRSLGRASLPPFVGTRDPSSSEAKEFDEMTKPLIYLVEAERDHGINPDAIYLALPRAAELLLSANSIPHFALQTAANVVVDAAMQAWKSPSSHQPASESAFDTLLSVMLRLGVGPSKSLNMAQLTLIHPTWPSTVVALEYLQGVEAEFTNRLAGGQNVRLPRRSEEALVCVALRCSELLLIQGDTKAADWVMLFLRKFFHHKLGIEINPASEASQETSDESFLRGFSVA